MRVGRRKRDQMCPKCKHVGWIYPEQAKDPVSPTEWNEMGQVKCERLRR